MRNQVKHIHFVGIGGSGMSGIAEVLVNLDFQVSGSDIQSGPVVQRLQRAGITVLIGHAAENIKGADVVVVSSAINLKNPEVAEALANNIPVIPRAEMLGELMRFQKGIAIAGTHGKTTTTSLVAATLMAGQMDPTFVVGGLVNSANTNAKLGKGEYLVAEADESDASFLNLQPDIVVVTNIDADHMSTYDGDFGKLTDTFVAFIQNIPFYGLAVLCEDDDNIRTIKPQIHKPILTYGFSENADIQARNISQAGATMRFDVHFKQREPLLGVELAMPGKHNILNSLAAIGIAYHLEVDDAAIYTALRNFAGIGRRFQHLGDIAAKNGSATVIDDYAHHPRELHATLEAARGCWPERRLVTVFQPHRYTRTYELFDDFVHELAGCEQLLICEVYPAGETPIAGADGRALCRAIRALGKVNPVFVPDVLALPQTLESLLQDQDVVLTLGAGSIGKAANELAEAMSVENAGEDT